MWADYQGLRMVQEIAVLSAVHSLGMMFSLVA
jgi:hypothetical protein